MGVIAWEVVGGHRSAARAAATGARRERWRLHGHCAAAAPCACERWPRAGPKAQDVGTVRRRRGYRAGAGCATRRRRRGRHLLGGDASNGGGRCFKLAMVARRGDRATAREGGRRAGQLRWRQAAPPVAVRGNGDPLLLLSFFSFFFFCSG